LSAPESRLESAWARRPSNAVSRLAGRKLLLLSSRDLLAAAALEDTLLVALVAPGAAAMLGFARAARDVAAPLLLARPSGSADEKGPEEARDDTAFVESAIQAASDVRFFGPMAFLKEPPRKGSAAARSVYSPPSRRSNTPRQLEASPNAPWTRTMVGLDMRIPFAFE